MDEAKEEGENISYFHLLMDDIETYIYEEINPFITDTGREELEGETALMMPFFYLFDQVNTDVEDERNADTAFLECVKMILKLGNVEDVTPALNTITKRYKSMGPMTVVDMLETLLDSTKPYASSITFVEGLYESLTELKETFERQGGCTAIKAQEMIEMTKEFLDAQRSVEGDQTDIRKMWQKLILCILGDETDGAIDLIQKIKNRDTPKNFKAGLMREQLQLGGNPSGMTACHAAVMKTNKEVFESLVGGLSDADKAKLRLLPNPPKTKEANLGQLALRMAKTADRDNFPLFLLLNLPQTQQMLLENSVDENSVIEKEQRELKKAGDIATMLGTDTQVLTSTSGFPPVYNPENVKMTYAQRWQKMMRAEKKTTGQTEFASLEQQPMTEDQFKSLKVDCLFGHKHLKMTPYQLNEYQLKVLREGTSSLGQGRIVRNGPGNYSFEVKGSRFPAVTDSQRYAGLTFNGKKYSFKDVHRLWVWANVAPFDETGNCEFYRLDDEGGLRAITRQFQTYDESDIARGELVLCNTKNHEKILDEVQDEKGKVIFMDKKLSAQRLKASIVNGWTLLGGAASGVTGAAAAAGTVALGGWVAAPLGILTAMSSWWALRNYAPPDEFLYCKVVRVLKRPREEAILKANLKANRQDVTAGTTAAATCILEIWGIPFARKTLDGWVMNYLSWDEAKEAVLALPGTVLYLPGTAQDVSVPLEDFSNLEHMYYTLKATFAGFPSLPVSAVLGILLGYLAFRLYNAKLRLVNGEIDSKSVLQEGYVQTQNLQHANVLNINETKWPKQIIGDVEIKWRLHENVLRQNFHGYVHEEIESMYYKPTPDENVLNFLSPAMVGGRAARTDFALHF